MDGLDQQHPGRVQPGPSSWSKPVLAELPSHYILRQVHATFQNDPVAVHNMALTGPDCLMWGNDSPHPESTYPNSQRVLRSLLQEVPAEQSAAVLNGNARRVPMVAGVYAALRSRQ
jgi:Amidohydrolase